MTGNDEESIEVGGERVDKEVGNDERGRRRKWVNKWKSEKKGET